MELPRWVWIVVIAAIVVGVIAFGGGGSESWDGSDCLYGGGTQDLSC